MKGEDMTKGKLYGVSVGPGDPELITLKAARILREADIVAAPSIGRGLKTALHIIEQYIEGKEVIDCSTPMTRDREASARAYEAVCDKLCALLDQGKTIAFLALGDAGVYSTYFYIHKRMVARGYDCEVVAGVPSFCAVAARLGTSLCEGAEQLTIAPVASGDPSAVVGIPGTKVLMKSGRELLALRDLLRERGTVGQAQLVVNCGLPGEIVVGNLDDLEEEPGSMSIVILKDAPADAAAYGKEGA